MPNDDLGKAKALIEALATLPDLTKASIEAKLGAELKHQPNVSADLQYYQAQLATGPYAEASFKQSNPQQRHFTRLTLEVRDAIELPMSAFEDVLATNGPAKINPDIPPEGSVTYIVQHRTGVRIHYEFRTHQETLIGILLER